MRAVRNALPDLDVSPGRHREERWCRMTVRCLPETRPVIAFFRRLLPLAISATVGVPVGVASADALPFTTDSFESISRVNRGQPFALVFWSVDCAPCIKELSTLAVALRQHPKMKLVLVSTDEEEARPRVDQMLARHRLDRVESWIFANADSRRLRYQVDPNWYGELPRSYLYDTQQRRVPLIGAITAERLDTWLRSVGQ